ncbi:hypothetical protein Tco_0633775 [Tanacetum coccineum]
MNYCLCRSWLFLSSRFHRTHQRSVGTSTTRVILFGTIPTAIPSTAPTIDLPVIHDDTPLIPTDTPTISPTIPSIASTIQYTSPFIDTDSSDSDIPDRPPSHDPYEVTVARWRSRVAARSSPPPSPIRQILPTPPELPRRPVVLVLPRRPIPVGRPYHSPSDSSSETSLDSHSDTSSYSSLRQSSLGYALSDSPCGSPTATSAGPSRMRCRSPTSSVPVVSPVRGALSLVCADVLLHHKRIIDFDSVTDFEVSSEDGYVPCVPIKVGLGV